MDDSALHDADGVDDLIEVQSRVSNFDINAMGNGGTALYWAAQYGNTVVVKLLLSRNSDVNIPDGYKVTPLMRAVQYGHTDVALALIATPGININHADEEGYSALMHAAYKGHKDCALALLSSPAVNVNHADQYGQSALSLAVQNGHTDTALTLIATPAININHVNGRGESALIRAAESGNNDVALALIATPGINVNHVSDINKTALLCACKNHHTYIALALIATPDINVNHADGEGETALIYVAYEGHTDVVLALIGIQGINVNHANKDNWTALIYAVYGGHTNLALALIATPSTNVNHIDNDGITSMHFAAQKGMVDTFVALLAHGADYTIKNKQGKTCFDEMSAHDKPKVLTKIEMNLSLLEAYNNALWFVIVQEDGTSDVDQAMDGEENGINDQLQIIGAPIGVKLFDKLLSTVESLVSNHPSLATAKDANNRAAVDVASKPIRKVIESVIFFCGQYSIHHGPPVHMSATAVVVFADDFGMDTVYENAFKNVVGAAEGGTMDQAAFGKALGALSLQGFGGAAELLAAAVAKDGLTGHFKHCDKDNDGSILMEEFVEYCGNMMGRSRRVAIKFMKNEDQYLRELSMRKNLEPQYVVDLLPGPDSAILAKAVTIFRLKVSRDTELSLQEYKYCIVMPAADRTLDAIFRSERPDMTHVRVLMSEIAHALAHLHQNNIIHGDLKMLNILRVDGHMRLIDLDAACSLTKPAGCKFSSGVLPPEMFARLTLEQNEQFTTYWMRIFTKNPKWTSADKVELGQADYELWEKIKPRVADGQLIVVKTFATDADNKPIVSGLPYSLVNASVSIDVWAFGVLLYYLVSASPLLLVNRDEDLLDGAFARILEWADNGMLQKMIEAQIRPKDSSAADLLLHLLDPNPQLRWDVSSVLKSDFFNPRTHGDGESSGATRQLMLSLDLKVSAMAKDVTEVKQDVKEVKKDVKTALVKLDKISDQIEDVKEFQRMGFEALQQQAMRYHEEDKDYFKAQAAMLDAQFELLKSVDGKIDGLSEQVAKGFLKMESSFDRVGAKLATEIIANGESQLNNFKNFQTQLEGMQADSSDETKIAELVKNSMSSMGEDITQKLTESMAEVTFLISH